MINGLMGETLSINNKIFPINGDGKVTINPVDVKTTFTPSGGGSGIYQSERQAQMISNIDIEIDMKRGDAKFLKEVIKGGGAQIELNCADGTVWGGEGSIESIEIQEGKSPVTIKFSTLDQLE